MPGRHFHFALEFTDEASPSAFLGDLVKNILCHAGLSTQHADEMVAKVLAAALRGAGPCRLRVDAGIDEVQILVAHAGVDTWRGVCPVE